MLPRAWDTIYDRRLTYEAVSNPTLDTEIGLATLIEKVVSAVPAFAVSDLTEIAVLRFVALDVCKVATRPRVPVASLSD